jgi:hypothetical protein
MVWVFHSVASPKTPEEMPITSKTGSTSNFRHIVYNPSLFEVL